MKPYRNEHLDRAVALMVLIVFLMSLFYAVTVIGMFWWFFRWFFCGVVICIAVWIVAMLFNIVWRYNAKTQVILSSNNIPLQWSDKINQEPEERVIHQHYQPADYNDYSADEEEDDDEYETQEDELVDMFRRKFESDWNEK